MLTLIFLLSCFVNNVKIILYTLIGLLSQHISVLTKCTYMMTSGMHRRPFEGRHLVFVILILFYTLLFFNY